MDDTSDCPICNNKLRSIKLENHFLNLVDKKSTFVERTCSTGMNHHLQFFTDQETKKVDFIKISLHHTYSRYIEINFIHQKCKVSYTKDGKSHIIEIPKLIIPDFPKLDKLKERVSLYAVFS
jgi:hypothetical protein